MIPKSNTSCAATGLCSGVGSRLSGMESREEAERSEEEGEEGWEEEEWPMVLEPEEEEIAMATGCWRIGVFCATWLWRKMSLP